MHSYKKDIFNGNLAARQRNQSIPEKTTKSGIFTDRNSTHILQQVTKIFFENLNFGKLKSMVVKLICNV